MEVKIKVRCAEVVSEVIHKTELASRSVETADNVVATENMQANTEEEKITIILRSMQNAMSNVLLMCNPYSPVWGVKTVENDIETYTSFLNADDLLALYDNDETASDGIKMDDLYLYLADMPSNFDVSVNDSLASLIHEYAVDVCLADWYGVTFPTLSAQYKDASQLDAQGIRVAISRRVRPSRKETTV